MSAPETEAALEQWFQRRVRLLGGKALKLMPTEKGVPDRLVLFPGGQMYLVELKTTVGQLSPAQVVWHDRVWVGMDVPVVTLYGRQECIAWLRSIFILACPESEEGLTAATG